ncbi:VanZ family protein [Bacillus sp. FJAT-53711]|uniref:VanZ family protein n=1 Tax=Bacillus yunxiaonensis TaxID=3127665 RepID=A0ABU8FYP5_9BACI
MTLEEYIKLIIKETHLPKSEKEELSLELYDHLTSLQEEFINQGKSVEEATQLAIQNFGEANVLGIEIEKVMNSSHKYIKWLGWGLFIPYSFILVFQLLLSRPLFDYFRNVTYFLETGNWSAINHLVNVIPFASTFKYIMNFDHYNLDIWLMNTIGNVVMFIPFGFFTPLLFPKVNNWKLTCKLFIKIIFFIELLQLITFTGIFDVDDIILNTTGALIGYSIFIGMKKLWIRYKRTDKATSF